MKRIAIVVAAIGAFAAMAWLVVDRAVEKDEMATLVGRVLMVGFDGRDAGDRGMRRTVRQIELGDIAGVMFLRRNVSSRARVEALTSRLLAAGRTRVPLVALDQEGGRVVRLGWRSGFSRVAAPLDLAATASPAEARTTYRRMASGLRDWGFNVNFGPVADLHRSNNPIIGRLRRSFGADPGTVTAYARAFVEAHEAEGVLTALKHFPGHGSSLGDTHLGSVDVTRDWSRRELEPFAALAGSVPMVMTGHIVNRKLGADGPATLSAAVVTDLLRGRMGFEGVVISDDLQMNAIADLHGEEKAAELALRAGIDLLLFGNDGRVDPSLVGRVTRHLSAVARRDPAFAARLREAGDRVDAMRAKLAPPPQS